VTAAPVLQESSREALVEVWKELDLPDGFTARRRRSARSGDHLARRCGDRPEAKLRSCARAGIPLSLLIDRFAPRRPTVTLFSEPEGDA